MKLCTSPLTYVGGVKEAVSSHYSAALAVTNYFKAYQPVTVH